MPLHPPVINPDDLVTYNGEEIKVKDVPDRYARSAIFGYGHMPIEKWRKVFPGYPHSPDTCTQHNNGTDWDWINDGQNLVCPGCGLEGT